METTEILENILHELKEQNAMKNDLWNASDIAHYMRLSKSSVQTRIICRKDFPRAVRVPTSDGLGGRRWVAHEVKSWLMKHRDPIK